MSHSRITPEALEGSAAFTAGPRMLAVMSGKGGVGKSIIAHNLAIAAGRSGQRALLVDLDWRMGNQHILTNISPHSNVADVIQLRAALGDAVITIRDNVSVLCSASAGENCEWPSRVELAQFLQDCRKPSSQYDLIILDTPSGAIEQMLAAPAVADDVALVVNPELTAISDTYGLYKWLLQSEPNLSASLLINRAENSDEATDIAERFSLLTKKFLERKPYALGYLQEDKAVRNAIARQRSVFDFTPQPAIAAQFTRLAGRAVTTFSSRTGAQRMSRMSAEFNLK